MINDEYNSQRAKEVTRADNFIMPGEVERYKEFSSANEHTLVEDGYNKNVTAKQAADRKKLLKILLRDLLIILVMALEFLVVLCLMKLLPLEMLCWLVTMKQSAVVFLAA